MTIHSHVTQRFEQGVVLDVVAEDLPLRAYVVISEPDLEAVTRFVPEEQFEEDAQLHVAAVTSPDEADAMIEDVLFNMNPHDAVALLCTDAACMQAALARLGCPTDDSPVE